MNGSQTATLCLSVAIILGALLWIGFVVKKRRDFSHLLDRIEDGDGNALTTVLEWRWTNWVRYRSDYGKLKLRSQALGARIALYGWLVQIADATSTEGELEYRLKQLAWWHALQESAKQAVSDVYLLNVERVKSELDADIIAFVTAQMAKPRVDRDDFLSLRVFLITITTYDKNKGQTLVQRAGLNGNYRPAANEWNPLVARYLLNPQLAEFELPSEWEKYQTGQASLAIEELDRLRSDDQVQAKLIMAHCNSHKVTREEVGDVLWDKLLSRVGQLEQQPHQTEQE